MTSSNKFLVILNSKDDIKLKLDNEQILAYSINSGSLQNENSKSLNSYKKFHKIAFEIKEQYINLIGNLAKYFENGQINRQCAYKDGLLHGFFKKWYVPNNSTLVISGDFDTKKAKELRASGFGIVNTHRANGIHSGTGILLALSDLLVANLILRKRMG